MLAFLEILKVVNACIVACAVVVVVIGCNIVTCTV